MSKIEVNTIETASGSTLTVGKSGDTVTLASGASTTGFSDIDWQSVINADGSTVTSAEAGKGYFINTFSSAHTINLPSSPSAGDTIAFVDYAGTFGTNNVTVGRGGSKIQGVASDIILNVDRRSTSFVYTDATKGWVPVNDNTGAEYASNYTQATGGTETTSGDFKIHTFNSSGNFVVTQVGQPGVGGTDVSYLVVAGGGGGGSVRGGGGGAGGFREGRAANDSYTVSPLNAPAGITLSIQTYPITVGAGGAGEPSGTNLGAGTKGSDSIFSTITSAGGGGGRDDDSPNSPGQSNGGSGGGAGGGAAPANAAGAGNTPPVSPPQGKEGGTANVSDGLGNSGAGGGGATVAGTNNSGGAPLSPGGAGATTHISASPVVYAGGGGAGGVSSKGPASGGSGGGGAGGSNPNGTGTAGTANLGGGGGGGGAGSGTGGAGGAGVVILRYKYQN